MNRREMISWGAFVDIVFNGLALMTAMAAIAFVEMNPKVMKVPALGTDGKYAIVMTWEDGSDADIDVYVRDPDGNTVWYKNRDTGLMNLEYDDRGLQSDQIRTRAGDSISVEKNQERVILRGVVPGEYIVNVKVFSMGNMKSANVIVKLYRLRGDDAELFSKGVRLASDQEEKTAFRFTLTSSEEVKDLNELPAVLSGLQGME
jgi:hypothetical protein